MAGIGHPGPGRDVRSSNWIRKISKTTLGGWIRLSADIGDSLREKSLLRKGALPLARRARRGRDHFLNLIFFPSSEFLFVLKKDAADDGTTGCPAAGERCRPEPIRMSRSTLHFSTQLACSLPSRFQEFLPPPHPPPHPPPPPHVSRPRCSVPAPENSKSSQNGSSPLSEHSAQACVTTVLPRLRGIPPEKRVLCRKLHKCYDLSLALRVRLH